MASRYDPALLYQMRSLQDVTNRLLTVEVPKEKIYENTVTGGGVASIDITNIPQTYRTLELYLSARSATAATFDINTARFNNNATANYYYQFDYGRGATVTATAVDAATVCSFGHVVGNTGVANCFGDMKVVMVNYITTTKNPSYFSTYGSAAGVTTNKFAGNTSGFLNAAGAITRITIFLSSGANYMAGTYVCLKGVQ